MDAVLEKHLQHVAHAGRQLQSKVEEQEEIIEAGLFEGLHVGSAAGLIDQESVKIAILQGSRVESVAVETKFLNATYIHVRGWSTG